MSVLFTDNFESNDFSAWTAYDADAAIAHNVAGMDAGYCLDLTNPSNYAGAIKVLASPVGEIWVAFDYMPYNEASAYGNILAFRLGTTGYGTRGHANGAYRAQLYAEGPDGLTIQAWGGSGAFTLATSAFAFSYGTKYRIEVHFKADPANGIFQVKVDGDLKINYSGPIASGHQFTGDPTIDALVFGSNSSDTMFMYIDNVEVSDTLPIQTIDLDTNHDGIPSAENWPHFGLFTQTIVLPTNGGIVSREVFGTPGLIRSYVSPPDYQLPQSEADIIAARQKAAMDWAVEWRVKMQALMEEQLHAPPGPWDPAAHSFTWAQLGMSPPPPGAFDVMRLLQSNPSHGFLFGGNGIWYLFPDASKTYLTGHGGFAMGGQGAPFSVTPQILIHLNNGGGFAFGGDGQWPSPAKQLIEALAPQVASSAISGGFAFGGAGIQAIRLVPAVLLVGSGGYRMGGLRIDSVVAIPTPNLADFNLLGDGGFALGGYGVLYLARPSKRIIDSKGTLHVLGGAGIFSVQYPAITLIIAEGGFAILGSGVVPPGFDTWVLTGNSFEPSYYHNYDFNSFAKIGEKYYGAKEDGIYLLEGPDDDGAEIIPGVRIGPTNLGTANLSRIRAVNVGDQGPEAAVRIEANGKDRVFPVISGKAWSSRDLQARELTIDIAGFKKLSHIEITTLTLSWD